VLSADIGEIDMMSDSNQSDQPNRNLTTAVPAASAPSSLDLATLRRSYFALSRRH